jgi:hypothetical protein
MSGRSDSNLVGAYRRRPCAARLVCAWTRYGREAAEFQGTAVAIVGFSLPACCYKFSQDIR